MHIKVYAEQTEVPNAERASETLSETSRDNPLDFLYSLFATDPLAEFSPMPNVIVIGQNDWKHTFRPTGDVRVVFWVSPEAGSADAFVPRAPVRAILACMRFQTVGRCGQEHKAADVIHIARLASNLIGYAVVDL